MTQNNLEVIDPKVVELEKWKAFLEAGEVVRAYINNKIETYLIQARVSIEPVSQDAVLNMATKLAKANELIGLLKHFDNQAKKVKEHFSA